MGFNNARATAHPAHLPTHHVATAHADATAPKVSSYCTVARTTSTVDLSAPKDTASPNVCSASTVSGAAYTVALAAPKDAITPMYPHGVRLSAQPTRWSPRPPERDRPQGLSRASTVAAAANSATPAVRTVADDNTVVAVRTVSITTSTVAPVGGQYRCQL